MTRTRTETETAPPNPTVRATTSDGHTLTIDMKPQRIGAMGGAIENAYEATICLSARLKGGLGPRAAIAMLAAQAKTFSTAVLNKDDLDALESVNDRTSYGGTTGF